MTLQLQIDSSGDLMIQAGRFVMVDDVAQRVTTRLRMLLGEWFLDTTDGTPYFQQILKSPANVDLARTAIFDRVRQTGGVQDVISVTIQADRVNRKIAFTVTAVGPSGLFTVSA